MNQQDEVKLQQLFFDVQSWNQRAVQSEVSEALAGLEDGELYLEYCISESLTYDDGTLKNANFDTTSGFGLRGVQGDAAAYAHASGFSLPALKRAVETVEALRNHSHSGKHDVGIEKSVAVVPLYPAKSPLDAFSTEAKIALLEKVDGYLRAKDNRVRQVSVSLSGEWQAVMILRADGQIHEDKRPLVRMNVSVVVEQDGRMERGNYGCGGRTNYARFLEGEAWQAHADEALRQALVNLESVAIAAGEMDVVLGPGWPGVLLHEAVGHGLEGDFNRKKTSAFSGLMGQRVAAPGVTVVDDGTLPNLRGSVSVDDEGTPGQYTTLIEDGILVGYMQDRMNARLMGKSPTGNGRRESFEYAPMPRMTNTYMLSGDKSQEELIASVKNGLFAVSFSGGQVDITSGKFVFSASEAYKIENGKITAPVKGATLIGNGPDCLTRIKGIGNDSQLDDGIGTCGKDGQSVPVGVGQPSMIIGNLTVGGTEVM